MRMLLALIACLIPWISARYVCVNSSVTVTSAVPVDFLFLIDTSGSMCSKITALGMGLSNFVSYIQQNGVDARFALVLFGGDPSIRLPFITNSTILINEILNLGCGGGGQEAMFEAIRRSLPPNSGQDLTMNCSSSVGGSQASTCNLNWRSGATPAIIVATDEDSDLPMSSKWFAPGQSATSSFFSRNYDASGAPLFPTAAFEPTWTGNRTFARIQQYRDVWTWYRNSSNIRLDPGYDAELQLTAKIVSDNRASVTILMNTFVGTSSTSDPSGFYWPYITTVSAFNPAVNNYFDSNLAAQASISPDNLTVVTLQFGDPAVQVQNNDLSGFDASATLHLLQSRGLGGSLQGRVLANGSGVVRLFDINQFTYGQYNGSFSTASSSQMVQNVFQQTVVTSVLVHTNCTIVDDPPSTSSIASSTNSNVASTRTIAPSSSSIVASTRSNAASNSLVVSPARSSVALTSSTATSTSTIAASTGSIVASSSSNVVSTSSIVASTSSNVAFSPVYFSEMSQVTPISPAIVPSFTTTTLSLPTNTIPPGPSLTAEAFPISVWIYAATALLFILGFTGLMLFAFRNHRFFRRSTITALFSNAPQNNPLYAGKQMISNPLYENQATADLSSQSIKSSVMRSDAALFNA